MTDDIIFFRISELRIFGYPYLDSHSGRSVGLQPTVVGVPVWDQNIYVHFYAFCETQSFWLKIWIYSRKFNFLDFFH